jgi:signal transduction histidine kinase
MVAAECDSEHLDAVASAHDRMETLIDDLLTLARHGDDAVDVEPVALAELVDDCWRSVATAETTLVVAVDADWSIRADRSRLRQLVENLLRNAVEHGGADVTVTVGALDGGGGGAGDADADDIEDEDGDGAGAGDGGSEGGFFVADDGPGVPGDECDRVFETGYSTASGTGLGLSIAGRVADEHGWSIRLADSEDGGARFEISGVEVVDVE